MGCKNFSPVCFYISTRVNVSFLVSSYFIPNLPLLTIVNGPTLFKSFAPLLLHMQPFTMFTTINFCKIKNTTYKYK
jgi:hypothetical protein